MQSISHSRKGDSTRNRCGVSDSNRSESNRRRRLLVRSYTHLMYMRCLLVHAVTTVKTTSSLQPGTASSLSLPHCSLYPLKHPPTGHSRNSHHPPPKSPARSLYRNLKHPQNGNDLLLRKGFNIGSGIGRSGMRRGRSG